MEQITILNVDLLKGLIAKGPLSSSVIVKTTTPFQPESTSYAETLNSFINKYNI